MRLVSTRVPCRNGAYLQCFKWGYIHRGVGRVKGNKHAHPDAQQLVTERSCSYSWYWGDRGRYNSVTRPSKLQGLWRQDLWRLLVSQAVKEQRTHPQPIFSCPSDLLLVPPIGHTQPDGSRKGSVEKCREPRSASQGPAEWMRAEKQMNNPYTIYLVPALHRDQVSSNYVLILFRWHEQA